jgi:hypothetical protein
VLLKELAPDGAQLCIVQFPSAQYPAEEVNDVEVYLTVPLLSQSELQGSMSKLTSTITFEVPFHTKGVEKLKVCQPVPTGVKVAGPKQVTRPVHRKLVEAAVCVVCPIFTV